MAKILITNPYHWESAAHVGMHHYATMFARENNNVAFISEPISPFHFFHFKTLDTTRSKFKTWRKGGKITEEGIFTYTPMTLLPVREMPLMRSKFACKNSLKFTIPPFSRFLKNHGFTDVDVLWNDSTRYYKLWDEITYKTSVVRIPDEIRLFQTLPEFLKNKEAEIIRKADIVITVSHSLVEKLEQNRGSKVHYLPNGVDIEHFSNEEWSTPADIQNIPEPRVIFVGVIGNWIDWDLVEETARKLPSFSFIFIGPVQIEVKNAANIANIYLRGSRPYSEIPNYLKSCQIGILPFHQNEFVDGIHPIKLYEYMSCGLPVVATRWRELVEIGSPAYLASGPDEFIDKINEAIEMSVDQYYTDKLKNYAADNTWKDRFKELSSILKL